MSIPIVMFGVAAAVVLAWLGAFVGPVFFFALAIVLPAVLIMAAFESTPPPAQDLRPQTRHAPTNASASERRTLQ